MSWRAKLKTQLESRLARLDRLTPRERIVVTVCICVVLGYVLDFIGNSARSDLPTWQELAVTQRTELEKARAELQAITSGGALAGDPALREQLGQIERDTRSIEASLRASQQYLVPPENMGALLQDLLRRDGSIEVLGVQTLPVVALLPAEVPSEQSMASAATPTGETPPKQSQPVANRASMFRHGVELTLRGDYLRVLEALQTVEKLPAQMYWGRLTMDARDAGTPVFHVWIYTLSLDKSWLLL